MTPTKALTYDEVFEVAHRARTVTEIEHAEKLLALYCRQVGDRHAAMDIAELLNRLKDCVTGDNT